MIVPNLGYLEAEIQKSMANFCITRNFPLFLSILYEIWTRNQTLASKILMIPKDSAGSNNILRLLPELNDAITLVRELCSVMANLL
jgi:hypothetical protein